MAIFRLERPQQGRRMQVGHAEIAILSQYLVPSRAVNAKCNTLSRHSELMTLVALVSGGVC